MAKRKHQKKLLSYEEVIKDLKVPQTRKSVSLRGGTKQNIEHSLILRPKPIAIGVPMDEIMFSSFFKYWNVNLNIMPWDTIITTDGTYLPEARNFIHNSFLDDGMLSDLFMIDSDVITPPNIIETLLGHKKGIVGGWYRNKKENNHPVVYDFENEIDGVAIFSHKKASGTGLEKVDAMGAGCWLISREVAEKVGRSPYDMNSGGEDMKFSRKLMKLGIPMYVDWSLNCAHLGVFHV